MCLAFDTIISNNSNNIIQLAVSKYVNNETIIILNLIYTKCKK